MPEPKITLTQNPAEEDSIVPTLKDKLNTKITRRDFVKGLGFAIGALALASNTGCKLEGFEKDPLSNNIEELNNQFEKIEKNYLDENGYFNFEPFKENPEFERYIREIHGVSEKLGRELDINPNVLKLMSSAIIATNIDNWERIGENISLKDVKERIGPMQYYPQNILDTLQNKLDDKYDYNLIELEGIFNVEFGIRHLVYGCLEDIRNDGKNRNLISLVLAKYYGGNNLLGYVKRNEEVPQGDFLRENYDLYVKTLNRMGINQQFPRYTEVDDSTVEKRMEEMWNKAVEVYWPRTKLEEAKQYLFKQAMRYGGEKENREKIGLDEQEYLALFISIIMAESSGGTNLGPSSSGALGWFQVIPSQHLGDYNNQHSGVNFNEKQLKYDTEVSIEVGTWALMRYRNSDFLQTIIKLYELENREYSSIKALMMYFKAGGLFNSDWQGGLWWNRVSYCMHNLLEGDRLSLGYMDFQNPAGVEHSVDSFHNNVNHIGTGVITDPHRKRLDEEQRQG